MNSEFGIRNYLREETARWFVANFPRLGAMTGRAVSDDFESTASESL